MQLVLPDGVTNATSSPRSVVAPSRIAERYRAGSAAAPPSTKVTRCPYGAPAAGGRADAVGVADVVDGAACVVLGGAVNEGVDCWASPPTECEHPATSTDAAIRPAIRITAKA